MRTHTSATDKAPSDAPIPVPPGMSPLLDDEPVELAAFNSNPGHTLFDINFSTYNTSPLVLLVTEKELFIGVAVQ